MAVGSGLAATADGSQVSTVALRAVRLREVADVQLRVERSQVVASVADEGLLAHVAYAARMIHMTATVVGSRIELCSGRLVNSVLILGCSRMQLFAGVMLMVRNAMTRHMVHRVRLAAGRALLAKLGLSNRLRNARVGGVMAAVTRGCAREPALVRRLVEKLRRHHHLMVSVAVTARRLPLIHQVEQVSLIGGR